MVSPKDISILVVDDDEALRQSLATNFRRFNFTVLESSGGDEAFTMYKQKASQIVVTDVRMAAGNGVDLLTNIKNLDPWNSTVLITSGFNDKPVDELYHLGADGFFDKPFTATQVRQAVTKALLNENDRWRNGIEPTVPRILKEMPKLELSGEGLPVGIGRGGFFISMWGNQPEVGSILPFTFQIGDAVPCPEVRGMGIVRWTRKEREGKLLAGIGVETLYLESNCLDKYVAWLRGQKILPFIPRTG